jgi:hypothetical protein
MFLMPGMVIALYTCGKLDQVGQQHGQQGQLFEPSWPQLRYLAARQSLANIL